MDRIDAAAAALRAAEETGLIADLPPGAAPRDEAEAYRIQDAVIGGQAIAGWKVTPAPHRCGALAVSRLVANGGSLPPMPAPEVEVEVAVMIARDLPPRDAAYTEAEVLAALGGLRVAFEIVQARYADRKAVPPLHGLADALSNGAFGLGDGFGETAADWADLDLGQLPVWLAHDGARVAEAVAGPDRAATLSALVWLANHARARGCGLRAGQAVITGARIGPRVMPGARVVTLGIDGLGQASFML